MKTLFMVRQGTSLVPAFPDDERVLLKYSENDVVRVSINKSHSPKQHRAVFAIARTVLMNAPENDSILGRWGRLYKTSPDKTVYNFVKMCEIELGFFDVVVKPDGSTIILPQSLSYDNMDKVDFSMFFQAYVDLCAKLLGVEPNELLYNYEE